MPCIWIVHSLSYHRPSNTAISCHYRVWKSRKMCVIANRKLYSEILPAPDVSPESVETINLSISLSDQVRTCTLELSKAFSFFVSLLFHILVALPKTWFDVRGRWIWWVSYSSLFEFPFRNQRIVLPAPTHLVIITRI